jgi:hypothetical protein
MKLNEIQKSFTKVVEYVIVNTLRWGKAASGLVDFIS